MKQQSKKLIDSQLNRSFGYKSLSLLEKSKFRSSVNKKYRLNTEYQNKRDPKYENSIIINERKKSYLKSSKKHIQSQKYLSKSSLDKIYPQKIFNDSRLREQQQITTLYTPSQLTNNLITTNQEKQQDLIQVIKDSKQWNNSLLPTLSAQQLYLKNHQLKKQCNTLRQENSKLTAKLLMQKKQKQKLAKQLNLQNEYYNFYERYDLFQNQSNSQQKSKISAKCSNKYGFHPVNFMITGIKLRYEKMKQNYQKKCKQVEEIIRKTQYTQIQQLIQYNKVLQRQNKQLVQKVQNFSTLMIDNTIPSKQTQNCKIQVFKSLKFNKNSKFNKQQKIQSSSSINSSSQELTKKINILIQAKNALQQSNQKLITLNTNLNSKLLQKQTQIKQKSQTIQKLSKSLLLLDNQLYKKKKQVVKLQKNKNQYLNKFTQIQKLNIKIKENCSSEISKIKNLSQKMFDKEKSLFLKQIQQKKERIAKLEKENSYLSTLLKYWKPVNQQQVVEENKQPQKNLIQESNSSQSLKKSSILLSNRKRSKTIIPIRNQKTIQQFKLGLKQPSISHKVSQLQDYESVIDQEQIEQRIPKTSRGKHSQKGYKVRKINPLQIQYIKQQIKYRCILKRLTIQEIRQYFQFNKENYPTIGKSQLNWKQKYISMKELKQIFVLQPFDLTQEQSHKFSRFIVQDTSADHVFCDQQNQIERTIVKSIMKAFIGEYALPNVQKCRFEWQKIIKSYGKNLRLALDSLSDKGIIASSKLFGLIQSLGIEIAEQLRNEIISRLYRKTMHPSRDINLLKYEYIFQQNFLSD